MIIDSNSFLPVGRYADVVAVSPDLGRIAELISGRIVIKDTAGLPLGQCNVDPSLLTHEGVNFGANSPLSELLILSDSHYLVSARTVLGTRELQWLE